MIRRRRPYVWWILSWALVLGIGYVAYAFATSKFVDWGTFSANFFSPTILRGIGTTLYLSAASLVLSLGVGFLVACLRLAPGRIARMIGAGHVWLFRGVPALVQLVFWFNLGLLFPRIGVDISWLSLDLSVPTNDLMSASVVAILGLGLSESAYMAEIIRSGIISVDPGQRDAAKAIGMTPWSTMTKVIAPQASRVSLPPLGNEVIALLKGTSLVSVIGVADLLNSAKHIYSVNLRTIELLAVATVWYLILVSLLTGLQMFIERRLGRGHDAGRGSSSRVKGGRPE